MMKNKKIDKKIIDELYLNKTIYPYGRVIAITLLSIIYFACMFKFYAVEYYVHDFSYYSAFHENGLPAVDGFSSMFLAIAGFITTHPKGLTIFCLLLMTLSIWNISFVASIKLKQLWKFIVFEVFLISCGCWYYFYGKLFYDFPFSAYTYSLCFILWGLIVEQKNKRKKTVLLLIFSFMEGFCLSWKPYNIFCVAGFAFLLFVEMEYRKIVLEVLRNIPFAISCVLFVISGYLCGNYKIFSDFQGTINGIKAYKASSDFYSFIFKNGSIFEIDFTNHLSFNLTTLSILTCIIFLFVLPLVLRKWSYLILSIIMTVLFYIYISYFSPGYAWHGFTFCLFVLGYVFCLLLNTYIHDYEKDVKVVLGFCLALILISQIQSTFIKYIPKQVHWFNLTQESISELENSSTDICQHLIEFNELMRSEDEKFSVWIPPKRMKIVNARNIYVNYDKRQFIDPVSYHLFLDKSGAFNGWWESPYIDEIRNATRETYSNYCDYFSGEEYSYVLYIVPNSLEELYSKENLGKIVDGGYNLFEMITEKDYNIYIYKKF